jgi:hypothetical protein
VRCSPQICAPMEMSRCRIFADGTMTLDKPFGRLRQARPSNGAKHGIEQATPLTQYCRAAVILDVEATKGDRRKKSEPTNQETI